MIQTDKYGRVTFADADQVANVLNGLGIALGWCFDPAASGDRVRFWGASKARSDTTEIELGRVYADGRWEVCDSCNYPIVAAQGREPNFASAVRRMLKVIGSIHDV